MPLGHPGQPVELDPVCVLLTSHEASSLPGGAYGASGDNGTACDAGFGHVLQRAAGAGEAARGLTNA
ncbi:hypothetical protein ACFQE0_15830 [Methylobacterium komagatae]|uniref:Uncharacterized protein n=1 Tax=Methylobacterium komagatae TaxID=374425 RepID=A0ABW2BKK6_9HYPH